MSCDVTESARRATISGRTRLQCRLQATLHIEGTRPRDTQVLPARGKDIGRPKALDKSKAALARRIADYIAGMTDLFAVATAERLGFRG